MGEVSRHWVRKKKLTPRNRLPWSYFLVSVFLPLPGTPVELDQIISKALAQDRAGRHRDAAELVADLRHLRQTVQAAKATCSRDARPASVEARAAGLSADVPDLRQEPVDPLVPQVVENWICPQESCRQASLLSYFVCYSCRIMATSREGCRQTLIFRTAGRLAGSPTQASSEQITTTGIRVASSLKPWEQMRSHPTSMPGHTFVETEYKRFSVTRNFKSS